MSQNQETKRIAIVGSDLSGLFCAWALSHHSKHNVTVFEKSEQVLKSISTIDFLPPGIPENCSLDFLPETYVPVDIKPFYFTNSLSPNLSNILNELRVELKQTLINFGFSGWILNNEVSNDSFQSSETKKHLNETQSIENELASTQNFIEDAENIPKNTRKIIKNNSLLPKRAIWIEWSSSSLTGLFNGIKNFLDIKFWRALLDFYRLSLEVRKESLDSLSSKENSLPIKLYLENKGYSTSFMEIFMFPIIHCGTNNTDMNKAKQIPTWIAKCIFRRYLDHSMGPFFNKKINVVKGGTSKLITSLKECLLDIKYKTEITRVYKSQTENNSNQVILVDNNGSLHNFDVVIFAINPKKISKILGNELTTKQNDILKSISFTRDRYVLHSDSVLLPSNPSTWSTINSIQSTLQNKKASCVTIWGNKLLDIDINQHGSIFVSINPTISPSPRTIVTERYYNQLDLSTKKLKLLDLSTELNSESIKFVGSSYSFNTLEYGCYSGLKVAESLGAQLPFDLVTPEIFPKTVDKIVTSNIPNRIFMWF
ncbi:hypothetical protein BB558_002626 [Smittium angustum]|uniref:Amine oxidase domain-containing protein n=1 Tax=Smittium angustum TaxID=133377 RepID=A0A2U1J888_SMIAN|nr:hypothetical protein BB558_002626 [Smittium angustum]